MNKDQFRFRVSIQVENHKGKWDYTTEKLVDEKHGAAAMAEAIAAAVVATCGDVNGPESSDLCLAMGEEVCPLFYAMAVACDEWTAACDFDNCVQIEVGIDALAHGSSVEEKSRITERLKSVGIELA